MNFRFRPELHPRNRLGRFSEVLGSLRPGDRVTLPNNVSVQRRRGGLYRVTTPPQRGSVLPRTFDTPSVEFAAKTGLGGVPTVREMTPEDHVRQVGRVQDSLRLTKDIEGKGHARGRTVRVAKAGLLPVPPRSPGVLDPHELAAMDAGSTVTDASGTSWTKVGGAKPLDAEAGYNWIATDGPNRHKVSGNTRMPNSATSAELAQMNNDAPVSPGTGDHAPGTVLRDENGVLYRREGNEWGVDWPGNENEPHYIGDLPPDRKFEVVSQPKPPASPGTGEDDETERRYAEYEEYVNMTPEQRAELIRQREEPHRRKYEQTAKNWNDWRARKDSPASPGTGENSFGWSDEELVADDALYSEIHDDPEPLTMPKQEPPYPGDYYDPDLREPKPVTPDEVRRWALYALTAVPYDQPIPMGGKSWERAGEDEWKAEDGERLSSVDLIMRQPVTDEELAAYTAQRRGQYDRAVFKEFSGPRDFMDDLPDPEPADDF